MIETWALRGSIAIQQFIIPPFAGAVCLDRLLSINAAEVNPVSN
jgi:hypothetical protein